MSDGSLLIMLGLVIKHFVADFLLQFSWMIEEKGQLNRFGGYAHAAVHGAGTAIWLWIYGLGVAWIIALALAEVAVHYAIDFTKARTTDHISSTAQPRLFWGLYGLDQLLHHLTYLVLTYLVVSVSI